MNRARPLSSAARALACSPLLVALAACGSAPEPSLVFERGSSSVAADDGIGEGAGDPGGASPSQGTFGSSGATPPGADAAAPGTCASSVAAAKKLPVHLVFMFDKSASMLEDQKWIACSSGMKSFFADPKSRGLHASLQFFPADLLTCFANYKSPKVSQRPLPNATDFRDAIDAVTPAGGTPTLPAIRGAIDHARDLRAQAAATDGGKVAIVLVTDGEPNDCFSSVLSVAAQVAAVKDQIPTYVIGVGNLLGLNAIAQAGGTKQAYIVSTNNPAQTTQELQKALAAIRGSALACDYAVPAPPVGKTLDLATVNVVYTPGVPGAAGETLSYDKACAGAGWRYDNPGAPTRIELCPTTCNRLRTDEEPKVEIALGCVTAGTNGEIPR